VIIVVYKVFAGTKTIMPNNSEFIINYQPIGKRVSVTKKESLLNAAQRAGIDIASICGGVGICDSCRIRLIKGELSELTLEEQALFSDVELKNGYRLACQVFPRSDLVIEIPPESLTAPQRLQIEGQAQIIEVDPAVIPLEINIAEPNINDLRADTVRLRETIGKADLNPPIRYSQSVIENISPLLRQNNFQVQLAMRKSAVVAILPPHVPFLGLAVDVGTTKLAAYLCDLQSGQVLAKTGAMNPQTSFGEDVISRISYTNNNYEGRRILQARLVETINQLIQEMCIQVSNVHSNTSPQSIVEAVVVGNTVMHHLFAGLPVRQLGMAPYVPAASESLEIDADRIGLNIASGAKIYLPPNIAGYVGADHVAMLLATGIWPSTKTKIALDIGTNTEISLCTNNRLIACSCASGPAFEGAHIKAGMRAAPGAIERVQIINNELLFQTIDNVLPIGICGSGILDAVACLRQVGALDQRGSLLLTHPSVRSSDNKKEFLLVDHSKSGNGQDIVITRQDVNEIQLAKGAIRTGIDSLLETTGIQADQIEEFIIAGAFGTYINVPSAIEIGMFPDLPYDRFHQVGNAAGAGARQMLLSLRERTIAEEIAKHVDYLELSTYPNFSNLFSKTLYL
jgi:uncharacterized 2Fe-2S/4Fe-4S cluster protein (DUF4445 family)